MAKAKNTKVDAIQKEAVIDFLNFVARKSKSNNIDQFLRNGQLKDVIDLFECGKYFLTHAMGCDEGDFIPNLQFQEFSCYVPVSENYYPWALFVLPTSTKDLAEFFDHHGRDYLLSADSGKKDFVVATNLKSISVFDFKHYDERFEVSFADLYDGMNGDETKGSFKNWISFLKEFGPEKVQEKKKNRRKEVIDYQKPKESSPELQYVKRFGHMPSFEIPVGYDGKNFRETFKTKDELPFLTTETVDWDGSTKKIQNRLLWGDNLAVMRSLPSESIDLIYIDPPFFSGRDYNCIFGDEDEVRSFKDIWDGGLPTYVAWLNARIWEMKRLLKDTGSIFVHLDWHASHYVKCEMDKIFGYDNFRCEIAWRRGKGATRTASAQLPRNHDSILWFSKSKTCKYNRLFKPYDPKTLAMYKNDDKDGRGIYRSQELRTYGEDTIEKFRKDNRICKSSTGREYLKQYLSDKPGVSMDSVWEDIGGMAHGAGDEKIGYPTQKPEELVKRIIEACSDEGDTVADFFSGGGTTVAVAEKLGRKWIGTDISRIAISVARDRISSIYDKEAGITPTKNKPTYGFSVDYHGIYERDQVREFDAKEYVDFILKCYGAAAKNHGDYIHGYKDGKAIFVAPSKANLKNHQIEEFCADLVERKVQNGVILAWNISKESEKYVAELRKGSSGVDIQIIQVKLVDIDSNEFKGDNIRFINKPAALIRQTQKSGLTWVFDATASCGSNGSDIHYFQWDFNYKNKFSPSTKPNFKSDADGDGNPLNDYKKIEFTFPNEGEFTVALRVFDKSGAEAITVTKMTVSKKSSKVA